VAARFSASVQTGPGAHPASCTKITVSLFSGVKRSVGGVDHPLPSSAEVKERVDLYTHSWPPWSMYFIFTLLVAFPLQQCLHKSASLLHYRYAHCLSCFTGPKPGDSPTQTAEETDRCSNELRELTARTATQGVCVLCQHCPVIARQQGCVADYVYTLAGWLILPHSAVPSIGKRKGQFDMFIRKIRVGVSHLISVEKPGYRSQQSHLLRA